MAGVSADVSVRLTWLRESAPGHLEADLGFLARGEELPLALMTLHPAQHCKEADAGRINAQLENGLESIESFERLPSWMQRRLKVYFGPLTSQMQLEQARHDLLLTRQVCDLVVRKARQVEGAPELHLPYFGRKDWLSRFKRLKKLTLDFAPDGRIVDRREMANPIEFGMSQAIAALAPAFKKTPGSNFTIAMQDRRRTTVENARVALDQVLADYGLRGALDGHVGETEITLIVRAPAEACNTWTEAPHGRTADFIPTYSRFSAAIQMALRRWLGWVYFGDGSRYDELNTAYAVLAYQVTRPYISETRSAFTYDVLDEVKMAGLCRVAGRRMEGKLGLVENYLDNTGQTQIAGLYSPRRASEIGDWLRKNARIFPSLLAGEGALVDEALNFAQRFGLCLRPRQFSRDAGQFVAGFDRKVRAVMRRCGISDAPAPPPMLVEAIGAMSLARGGPAPELMLQITSETKTSVHRSILTRCDSLSPL